MFTAAVYCFKLFWAHVCGGCWDIGLYKDKSLFYTAVPPDSHITTHQDFLSFSYELLAMDPRF